MDSGNIFQEQTGKPVPVQNRRAFGHTEAVFRHHGLFLFLKFEEVLRRIDDNIEWRGAAELAVDDFHAAIDFRVFLVVVDESDLPVKEAHPPYAQNDNGEKAGQNHSPSPLNELGKIQGHLRRDVVSPTLRFGLQQHQRRRKQGERKYE